MKGIYETRYLIPAVDCDENLNYKPFPLLNLLQVVADEGAYIANGGFEQISKLGFGWFLLNYDIDIIRMPRYRENLKILTWANAIGGLKTVRSFEIQDEQGNVIVKALTLWILVNLETRRPLRLDNLDLVEGSRNQVMESTFAKIKDIEKNNGKSFETFFQQSDYNGHINNAIYLWWAIETLGENFFKGKVMKDLKINYINETKLGQSVTSYVETEDNKTSHIIVNNETGKDCAKLEFEWQNI